MRTKAASFRLGAEPVLPIIAANHQHTSRASNQPDQILLLPPERYAETGLSCAGDRRTQLHPPIIVFDHTRVVYQYRKR